MEFKTVISKISEKYGEDIDIKIYPDFSGHISTSKLNNCDSIVIFSWDNFEELVSNLKIHLFYVLMNIDSQKFLNKFQWFEGNEIYDEDKIYEYCQFEKDAIKFGSHEDAQEFIEYCVNNSNHVIGMIE